MNDKLFFLVWRNKYILFTIFKFLNFYNLCNKKIKIPIFDNLKSFLLFKKSFKFYDFFDKIKIIIFDKSDTSPNKLVSFLINLKIFNSNNNQNNIINPKKKIKQIKKKLYQILEYFDQSIIGIKFYNPNIDLNLKQGRNYLDYLSFKKDLIFNNHNKLPSSVVKLSIDESLSQEITEIQLKLSNRITSLKIPNIDIDLPNNLINLKYILFSSKLESNKIPSSCKSIDLGYYNRLFGPSNNYLSNLYRKYFTNQVNDNNDDSGGGYLFSNDSKLEYLRFGYEYGCTYKIQVGHLTMLKYLKVLIISSYHQTLDVGIFPNSIIKLKFEYDFNNGSKPLKCNCLPSNLKELYLSSSFNQTIEVNALPKSLEYLYLGSSFNQIIENGIIPINNLKTFHLDNVISKSINLDEIDLLKTNIIVTCNNSCINIPNSIFNYITQLNLSSSTTTTTGGTSIFNLNYLPPNLKIINFEFYKENQIDYSNIPDSITSITLPFNFNRPLNGCFKNKSNLIEIKLNKNYSFIIYDDDLPNSIKHLSIGNDSSIFKFEHSIETFSNNQFPNLIFYYIDVNTSSSIPQFQYSNIEINNFQFNNNLNSDITQLYNQYNNNEYLYSFD